MIEALLTRAALKPGNPLHDPQEDRTSPFTSIISLKPDCVALCALATQIKGICQYFGRS
jgi:hypothetical protein